MATDQLALLVSIASVLIASLALGWNVYRDVVLKPTILVRVAVVTIIHESLSERPQYVNITATNHGPGPVTASSMVARNAPIWRRILRKVKYAYITPDYANPHSGRIPTKLEVGDKVELMLPYDQECLLGHPFTHVGITDFFGRTHWSTRRAFRKARSTWEKDFARKA